MLNSRARGIAQKTAALATLGPLFAATYPAVALTNRVLGKSPIFFKQKRFGQDGKAFNIWKFRTMEPDKNTGEMHSTKVGAFLRKTSLDELPQLFNIMAGDMELTGWRPLMMRYSDVLESQLAHLNIKPADAELRAVKENIALMEQTKPGVFGTVQFSRFRGTHQNKNYKNFVSIARHEGRAARTRDKSTHLQAAWQDTKTIIGAPISVLAHKGHTERKRQITPGNDGTAPT